MFAYTAVFYRKTHGNLDTFRIWTVFTVYATVAVLSFMLMEISPTYTIKDNGRNEGCANDAELLLNADDDVRVELESINPEKNTIQLS